MTEGFKRLFGSYKGTAFLLCIIIVGALVGAGKVPFEQYVDFIKWAFGALVVARAGEEGLKGLGSKK